MDITLTDDHAWEALKTLHSTMQASHGPIEDLREGLIFENPYFRMTRNAFVFDTPGGAKFRYDGGLSLVLDNPSPDLDAECRLYQWGTVYGAVAWMNRLTPLHASCVTNGIRSVAFTANSGAGKSTLAAGLTTIGWQSVCDDTMVLARGAESFFALPDGKPCKLAAESAGELELRIGDPVPFSTGKFYVELPQSSTSPTPVRDLILLEDGPDFDLAPITGAEKMELIGASLYRGFVHSALTSASEHAEMMLELANSFNCWRLTRPKSSSELKKIAAETEKILGTLEY